MISDRMLVGSGRLPLCSRCFQPQGAFRNSGMLLQDQQRQQRQLQYMLCCAANMRPVRGAFHLLKAWKKVSCRGQGVLGIAKPGEVAGLHKVHLA